MRLFEAPRYLNMGTTDSTQKEQLSILVEKLSCRDTPPIAPNKIAFTHPDPLISIDEAIDIRETSHKGYRFA